MSIHPSCSVVRWGPGPPGFRGTGALCVDPVPRNIHPVHNEGRQRARAEAIKRKIGRSSSAALFVDAAQYWMKEAYVVTVVNGIGCLVNASTVITRFPHEAEELAIVVAFNERRRDVTIFSDSRTAIRSFSSGFVSTTAAHSTNQVPTQENELEVSLTHIARFPAHMGNLERAHELARELATRSDRTSWEAATHSTELDNQLLAVQRARHIAERLHLPAPSWAEPPG
ncbi:hypothetical protein HPB51_017721 [Rhipicephalus microplus]|uniref:Tick transposon n=1 Tax=Rhipicephalus microplus TaxID=6941 RepID=A0A9J6E229_RHIMP|nr:hypothetical protein HPB51_017721 [Rhipicephalus microplus]